MILVVAYGHLSFMLNYKHHKLYDGDKDAFLERYCAEQRREEIEILRQLAPHMIASRGKLWMITLVTKQDLWWPERKEVIEHYGNGGEYGAEIAKILAKRGGQTFRHELVPASLVISNFATGAGESLKPNAAGYDQPLQVQSLRGVFEAIDALRKWEANS